MPEPTALTLTLSLHGDAFVASAQGHAVRLERRAAALCALAALEPGFPRERAAAWLWPDSADPRRNLRQQLLRFKQQFGQAVLVGEEQLMLAPGVVLSESSAPLLQAQRYDDCTEFLAWLEGQRAALNTQRAEARRAVLAQAEAAGDLDAALDAAQRGVAEEVGCEANWQELMRIHYLRGEPAAGLAVYQRLSDLLQTRYGTPPAAASTELADALRRAGRHTPDARGATAWPTAQPARALPVTLKRPPLLAGRDAELAAVQEAWARGQAALIDGEAGLGKSRLIAELTAGDNSAWVTAGRPGDSGAPYATLARLLAPKATLIAPLSEQARLTLSCVTPAAAAAVAGAAVAATPLRPGAMAAAVAELLQYARVRTFVLDDLHFADAASIELFSGLASAPETPLRWLFAQRPAEAPGAAQDLRDALGELQRLVVVQLQALDDSAAAQLVESLAIPGLQGPALASALVRHTGGNPLYLLETLKQGLQDGSLARGELPRPTQVGSLIERRLQRLSEAAITLARVAAIAGVDFSIELAEAATGQRAVQLAGAWKELQDAQVLRGEAFAHDLVADAALRSVPPVVARRVHAQCAQWLAAQGVEPSRVAWHWQHGGKPAEAARAFMVAAKHAELAARLREEADLYGHAARAFAEAGLDEARFDALLLRVRALNGIAFGDMALKEAHALLAHALNDSQRMQAHVELCDLYTERSEPQAAIDAGQAALALARAQGNMEWQVRTACHMATALTRLGRAEEAVALLAPLRAWVGGQPDAYLSMLWHGDWGSALGHAGRLRDALAAYEQALAAARRTGSRDAEGRLLMNCAVTLRQNGQFDRALGMAREGHALSLPDTNDATALPIGRLVLARDMSEAGQYTLALPELDGALAEFARRRAGFWVQATHLVLARMWLDLGQFARAAPLLGDDDAELPAWLRADRRLLRLDLARELHQPAPTGLLDEALALASTDPVRGPLLQVRALRHQPPARVLSQADTLTQVLQVRERYGGLMALRVHLARAAMVAGDTRAAARAAQGLLAAFEEGHAPDSMYRAEAWWVAHQALVAGGHAEAATRALRGGEQWLRQVALPQVPPPFIDSFLRRNVINRDLLTTAGR